MPTLVKPRHPETGTDHTKVPERMKIPMTIRRKRKPSHGGASAPTVTTLQHVLNTVEARESLSVTRRRDLGSSVTRVASLLGEHPERIPLDLPALSVKLAAVNPVAAGLTSKTFSNIRSGLL